jgi:hypothetical protein
MKFLRHLSQEEKLDIIKNGSTELLTNLSQNRAKQQIEEVVKRWKENMIPVIQKEDVAAEDITMGMYIRKKCFLYFLPDYCSESDQLIRVIEELDLFIVNVETACFNTYLDLLRESISSNILKEERITTELLENEYLYKRAEAITHLGSYKWNLKTNELTWSDELYRIYGLDPQQDTINFEFISSFNIPEDTPNIRIKTKKFYTQEAN